MARTPSAWAKPESTPAPEVSNEPLMVVMSEKVSIDNLPPTVKSFIKLAMSKGWRVEVRSAAAQSKKTQIRSWSVKVVKSIGAVVVWELHTGVAPKTKRKCHVETAYSYAEGLGLQKATITDLKNIIKESK